MTEIITALRNMAGGTGLTGADLVTFGQDHIRPLLAHIDAQAAEIALLRADAERYRWLKSKPSSIPAKGPELTLWLGDDCGDYLRGDDADVEIDAARKEATK